MLEQLDNSNISKHLGKSSEYIKQYDNSLLVREPRSSNRKHLKIDDAATPFVGYDVWNGYEVSALCDNGLPVAGVAKVVYPANNKYIVESKSMKLYWNSFNMTHLGKTASEVMCKMAELASKDLSVLLETDVRVSVVASQSSSVCNETFDTYQTIEDIFTPKCSIYTETPSLLKVDIKKKLSGWEDANGVLKLRTSLLKSNCRVTGAPDFGDAFIRFKKSTSNPDPDSLIQYVVSFRDECHFHEEICEALYTRLNDTFKPLELSVSCLYTRRGGWDIVPVRANHAYLLPVQMLDPNIPYAKTSRQ